MNSRLTALVTLSLFAFSSAAFVASLDAGELISITPTGSVKQVQQVVAKFSTDMVAMGDPRSKTDPLKLDCNQKAKQTQTDDAENGEQPKGAKFTPKFTTRWADTKTWSLDFEKPLPAGVKCTLTFNSVAKDLAGSALTGAGPYSFSTGGPALLSVAPRYGDIEPDQYFVLQLDGPLDTKSLEAKAYFEAEGIPDRINVKLITGKDREVVIGAAVDDNWDWYKYKQFIKEKKWATFNDFIVVGATRKFPEDRNVTLHWPKGILAKSGVPVDEPQDFNFHVIPPFEAKFNCDRTAPERPCNPILNLTVNFTRRVKMSALKGAVLKSSTGQTWTPIELATADQNKNFNGPMATGAKSAVGLTVTTNFADKDVDALTFKGPFPEKTNFTLSIPKGLKDELGRKLINEAKFPLATATDSYSPLLKFAAPFGVLELNAEPALPVSVRNVEKNLGGKTLDYEGKSFVLNAGTNPRDVIDWYHKLKDKEQNETKRNEPLITKGQTFSFQKPGGERDFELVGIPMKEPGFHIVELASPRLGAALTETKKAMYVASGALVTNLSVHFKKGRESSAVWVTTLDNAKPVASAQVSIYDNKGKSLATGKTDAQGIWRIARIKFPCESEDDEGGEGGDVDYSSGCEVYAFAKLGSDFSFTSNTWHKGIETYRFNLMHEYVARQWGPVLAHTIFDRVVTQAGETINMKHLVRERTSQGMGFRALPAKYMPKHVLVVHSGSRKTYDLPVTFDPSTGAALTSFQIPKEASLGMYEVYLSNQTAKKTTGDDESGFDYTALNTGRFMVAEYRLPLMEGTVKIQGAPLVQVKDVNVDLSANYLSGGPASGMKVKVRAYLGSDQFTPDVPDAQSYTFFTDPVQPGLRTQDRRTEKDDNFVSTQDLILDKSGGLKTQVKGLPLQRNIRSLIVEMEYRDPNGEIKTSSATQKIFPGQTIVGLRSDSWMATAGKASVQGILVNEAGKPLVGQAYTVEAFSELDITHRKRLVGGFYAYDSQLSTKSLGQVCSGNSDKYGRFTCEAQKMPPGSLILQAKALDAKNRATYASASLTVYADDGNLWFTPSDSDRIDLIPEKTKYEPGEKAVIAIRSPFPTSTVLVTIEREGIMDAWTTTITRDQTTIEVPIKPNYGPNIFVSAIALRGRVAQPSSTALIDLAKPAMKLGLVELKVGWKPHELKVAVTTDKKKYHVRDKVQAHIHVAKADGSPLPAGSEVALVAVDEALELLRRNWSFDLLSVMMGQRGLAVDTATSQNQVIGKRHFGAKAKPPGGGGGKAPGSDDTREFFDPMLLWNGRVKLDAKGDANVVIPLNDSITSFKIMAAATGGLDLFGDGNTRIEASKDLIIYSGFAPLVRDGDQITNRFTLRNTTEKPMNVTLTASSVQMKALPALAPLTLAAGESKTLTIPVTVPAGLKEAQFTLNAKDSSTGASDSMIAKVKIDAAVPDRVLMATLFQLEKPTSIPVKQPADALPNRGSIDVKGQDTLVRGLATMKNYMEDYPYSCLEQRVSKAIVSEDNAQISTVINQMPSYFDGSGLLKFFPSSMCGEPQLNRYILDITNENGYALPDGTRNRALDGLQNWLDGRQQCHSWWSSLVRDNYRDQERVLVMETMSRYKRFNLAMIQTIQQTPNLWNTEAVTAWYHLLKAEDKIPKRDELLKQADNILHARVNYQGSTMNLQGKLDWEGKWMLFTSADQEALGVFGIAMDAWKDDAGKMARGIISRMKLGVWDSTLANAWAITELRKFSAKYENVKVTGVTNVTAGAVKNAIDWTKTPGGADLRLAWPPNSATQNVNIDFAQSGTGKPWMLLQTRSAIPLKAPWDLGYKIARKLIPVSQKTPGKWSDGDVVNVQIKVTAKYDQPWVVVRDPIPAGASHLGTGLDGTSALLDRAPKQKSAAGDPDDWPTEFEEKSNASFISYAAYLQKGAYRLNYRIRLNSSGLFRLPPSRVEAMYSPETFGESPNGPWQVQP